MSDDVKGKVLRVLTLGILKAASLLRCAPAATPNRPTTLSDDGGDHDVEKATWPEGP